MKKLLPLRWRCMSLVFAGRSKTETKKDRLKEKGSGIAGFAEIASSAPLFIALDKGFLPKKILVSNQNGLMLRIQSP